MEISQGTHDGINLGTRDRNPPGNTRWKLAREHVMAISLGAPDRNQPGNSRWKSAWEHVIEIKLEHVMEASLGLGADPS